MNGFDIFGGIVDAAKLGYNLYTNKRDFDYQKALQQQIFQREDTAVQRRMADLQAAGLNPNIAAGSAAGAGAVVSRSNTNDLGSALDTVQALNSIKAQRQQVQNAQEEYKILKQTYQNNQVNNNLNFLRTMRSLGFDVKPYMDKYGDLNFEYQSGAPTLENTVFNAIDLNNQNLSNSADYLQKELNWYTANQVTNLVTSLLPNIGFSFGKRFK